MARAKKESSKTADAATNATERKAAALGRPTVVPLSVCEACRQCAKGLDAIARRDKFRAKLPTGAYISTGTMCILRKSPTGV